MSVYSELTANHLVDFIRAGDQITTSEICERCWRVLIYNALKITGENDETKDIDKELFAKFCLNAEHIEPETYSAPFHYFSTKINQSD